VCCTEREQPENENVEVVVRRRNVSHVERSGGAEKRDVQEPAAFRDVLGDELVEHRVAAVGEWPLQRLGVDPEYDAQRRQTNR
jgi:hypothetical protein